MNISKSERPSDPERRAFLADALKLAAGALLLGKPLHGTEIAEKSGKPTAPRDSTQEMAKSLSDVPARAFVDPDGSGLISTQRNGSHFHAVGISIECIRDSDNTIVKVSSPTGPLTRAVLRWETAFPVDTLYLGDDWERSYGDLQWRYLQPERVMPWYFAAHHPSSRETFMAGVMTQPSALCFWTVDAVGVSLWLDFRNGGSPCRPGDREISAATVVSLGLTDEVGPFVAVSSFCRTLCLKPRLSPLPICGNNNWYYAYGRNFDADVMRRDAEFLAQLALGHPNRPYAVIDAGWTPGSTSPGGPWTAGDPKRFPDMPGLAKEIKRIGVHPGIWMRPSALTKIDNPRRLSPRPSSDVEKPLDLTLSENLVLVHDDVARIHS